MSKNVVLENDKEMNVVGHLSELRKRIMITAILFIVFFVVGFIYVRVIYVFLEYGIDFDLVITSQTEVIWIYIFIAAIIAKVRTLPILSIQLWLFIKPGLKANERKASLSYIPPIFFLFVIGLVLDRKSTRLNSSHVAISYAAFCLKKKNRHTCSCCESSEPQR